MSSKMINIAGRGPVDDPHYRYKMPSLICKHEKKWTVLVNLRNVADALHRSEDEVLKYLAIELNTQTPFRQGRPCAKGQFMDMLLQMKMREYIEGFVLCGRCKYPETAYRIRLKSGTVSQKCFACGSKTPLCMDHKVSGYIVTQFKAFLKTNKDSASPRFGIEAGARLPSRSKIGSSVGKQPRKKALANEDSDDSSTKSETTKEARPKSPSPDDELDDEQALAEAITSTQGYLRANADAMTCKDVLDVVKREQKASVLMGRERIRILVRATIEMAMKRWGEKDAESRKPQDFVDLIPDPVFRATRRLVEESSLVSRYLEDYVIACTEEAVCLSSQQLKPAQFVLVLKAWYDNDVLEEEAILRWAAAVNPACSTVSEDDHKRLQNATRPFVRWIEEAETDSSSDEEEK